MIDFPRPRYMDDDFNLSEIVQKAESGDMYAQWDLFYLMTIWGYNSKNIEFEKQKAYYTNLRHLVESGVVSLYVRMGNVVLKGIGCEQNTEEAVRWYQKAAENDDPLGNESIGEVYYLGIYAPIDYRKAYEYFTKDAGTKTFNTRYHLGEMYRQGLYVNKDSAKACEYYTNIVEEKIDRYGLDDYYWHACYRLAVALHYGEGVECDLHRSRELLLSVKKFLEEDVDLVDEDESDMTIEKIEQELKNLELGV